MKNINKLFIFLFFITGLIACEDNGKKAIEYNDAIVEEQIKIAKALTSLQKSYENYVAEEMQTAHKKALTTVENSITKVQNMPLVNDDTSLRVAALKLFGVYKNVLEVEHKEMIRLYKLPEDKYGEAELKQWENLSVQYLEKMQSALKDFQAVQAEYAKKHNFMLLEEQTENQADTTSKQ